MTLHLAPELERRLQDFAVEAGRTPDDVAQEAVDGYIQYLRKLAGDIREGEESAERDGWVTQDEVFDRLNTRLQKSA